VWIGTIQTPISANILGIVKGSGFFMFGGQAIENFPPGSSGELPGVCSCGRLLGFDHLG